MGFEPAYRPYVAPSRERGLKLFAGLRTNPERIVAPSRERGLKLDAGGAAGTL